MTIRSDATRLRITPHDPRPQRAVAPRQGQVLLDADLQQDGQLTLARIDGDMADVIGAPGRFAYPAGTPAFAVQSGGGGPFNLTIQAGHGFLDGWRLDNMAECTLDSQPHPRTGDTPIPPAVMAIKALVRHIDPVEEPALADKALGDAQASGRLLVDWQVFPQSLTGQMGCANVLSNGDWRRLSDPSSGTVEVRVEAGGPGTDPCSLLPQGGYSRLENLLYRLEVHGGVPIPTAVGAPDLADGPRLGLEGLKLKVSRRNASVLVAITGISGTEITVSPPAPDPRAWFAPGAWAEIVSPTDDLDPRAALANERLFRVAEASDERVTLEATPTDLTATGASGGGGWFLRLWDALPDGSGLLVLSAPDGTGRTPVQPLGDGLLLCGGGGATATFRRGDHWTFAARADGTIDWGTPGQQSPHGPSIRYAPLALVSGGTTAGVEDCRLPFARLTDRVLHYRGGDGQSAYADAGGDVPLAGQLRLAVLRGSTPVAGAVVAWSLPAGAQLSKINGVGLNAASTTTSTTNAQGEIAATWTLDGNAPDGLHQVTAKLLGDDTGQPVVFTARFDTARTTSYSPGNCKPLSMTRNVQDAIDGLCAAIDSQTSSLRLSQIDLIGEKKEVIPLIREEMILNGEEVPFNAFQNGIAISLKLSQPLVLGIATFDPIVEVELDLPYPASDSDKRYWWLVARSGDNRPLRGPWAFQRLRLDGVVSAGSGPNQEPALLWQPSPLAKAFLATAPQHLFGWRTTSMLEEPCTFARLPQTIASLFSSQANRNAASRQIWDAQPPERILVRLRVRSAHVWVEDTMRKERVYLNAEHLGINGPGTGRELALRERERQRAADLELFFYLLRRSR